LVALGLTRFAGPRRSSSAASRVASPGDTLNVPVLLASGAANIGGVEFDPASDSFVAIDQRRFLPDLPDSRAEDDSTAGGGLQSSEPPEPVDPQHQLSNTTGISAMNVKNFGQITNDISGNNGSNAADYRIIQMAVKFAF
jgi:hypothetical protein